MAVMAGWPVLAALLLFVAVPARAACVGERPVEAPMRIRDGFAFIPAMIGGVAVTFLLDTGAQGHLLTPEAAAALDLPPDAGRTTRLLGTGGSLHARNVVLRGVTVGGAALPDGSVPVAPLPGVPRTEPLLAGLLGAPLLAAYDLELDALGGRIVLSAPACDAPPLPAPFSMVTLEMTAHGEVLAPVWVNGVRLRALVDTGSRATILTEAAARRLGLDGPPSANVARGIDGSPQPVRHTRVATLQVGGHVMNDQPVSVAPMDLGGGDMLLGLDFLKQRRIWLSYRTGRMAVGHVPR